MSSKYDQISAFAVYTKKRNLVTPLKLHKFKKKLNNKSKRLKNEIKVSTNETSTKRSSFNKKKNNSKNVSLHKINNHLLNAKDVVMKSMRNKYQEKIKMKNTLYADIVFCNNLDTSVASIKNNLTVLSLFNEGNDKSINNKKLKDLNKNNKSNTIENNNYLEIQSLLNKDPVLRSCMLLDWLIHPLTADTFIRDYWEKKVVFLKRDKEDYYKNLMSTPILDKILRNNHILFSKNIDITSYDEDVRENHNPEGRALPTVVWDYYRNGCSVRMLNPQTYLPNVNLLNATLQEYFGCFVGSNCYLTPPGSQGFAPHYDDIEAFILQIEGKKRWRLYKMKDEKHHLPRYSSKDLKESDLQEPFFDEVLEAGDMLYMPRGIVHQGVTNTDDHSLHLTLSVYQKNAWCDLLEKLIPNALEKAITNNSAFREGLPLNFWKHFGFVHSEGTATKDFRASFERTVKSLVDDVKKYLDIDQAVDEIVRGHIHDFLPPYLLKSEQKCTSIQDGEKMVAEGVVKHDAIFKRDTKIRLIRAHCIRLIKEKDGIFNVYYSCDNSKVYHENELQFVEIDELFIPGLKELILKYPKFIKLEDLPIEGEDNQYQMTKDLWEKGIIMTETPLVSSNVQND